MRRSRAAMGIYASVGLVSPIAFWAYGRTGTLDSFSLQHFVSPLAIVSLVLAATRVSDVGMPLLEVAIAMVWGIVVVSQALWSPLHSAWADSIRMATDIEALVASAAATGMGVSAARAACASRMPWLWRTTHSLGLGMLALYLLRVGAQAYLLTRVSESAGLSGLVYEGYLRTAVCAAVSLTLGGSALALRKGDPRERR